MDKAQGSKKLIERLVEKGVPGIIATHDLSLCDIAKDLKEVKNYSGQNSKYFLQTLKIFSNLDVTYYSIFGFNFNVKQHFLLSHTKAILSLIPFQYTQY